MNVVNRIELAVRRAASQMPKGQDLVFKLLADELANLTHDDDTNTDVLLQYRDNDAKGS